MTTSYVTFFINTLLTCAMFVTPSFALEIAIKQGTLQGREEIIEGKYVRSFLGVPFAEPPLGHLRFRPPVEKKPWNGTFIADTPSPACYQEKDTMFGSFWGSDMWNANTPVNENCLFLNIWAPKTTLTKAAVMVWLFGGGFWYGSPSLTLYDGRVLAAVGHVVVVNVNYRVGPFGFLFLDHEEIPGNMGMLDQQLALKWIQENIKFFDGDPEKVSIFGESAGAASIVAHMIAKDSRNLFQNGILQSGSLDNPWAMDTPERALEKSMALVKASGCKQYSAVQQIASCLRQGSSLNYVTPFGKLTDYRHESRFCRLKLFMSGLGWVAPTTNRHYSPFRIR